MLKISDLAPNPKNPRTISDDKLAMLKKALLEFGDLSGIVYNRKTKQLVGGHQRAKILPASAKVEIEKSFKKPTPVGTIAEGFVEFNGERFKYREVVWDEYKEKAANIAANKGAGEWDLAGLSEWMRELETFSFDLDLTLFSEQEREDLLQIKTEGTAGQCDEDEIPEPPKVAKTKLGDIYQLGPHRLMCGDSTQIENFDRLMQGKRAKISFTSPPYNLGENMKLRGQGKDSAYIEKSDHKSQEEYLSFLGAFTQILLKKSDAAFINIQMLAGNKLIFPEYWYAFRDKTIDVMIWDKEHSAPAMAPNVLNSTFEFIFIFTDRENPNRAITTGEDFRGTVQNIYRLNPLGKKDEMAKDHGAVFPVQFPEFFINQFSKAGDFVIEPFGGSGSTLIACEKTGRKCFAMELDPRYCDLIVARWEKFTGKKAVLKGK